MEIERLKITFCCGDMQQHFTNSECKVNFNTKCFWFQYRFDTQETIAFCPYCGMKITIRERGETFESILKDAVDKANQRR